MAITKSEIVTVLNSRLNRAETTTTLAEQIRSVLYDLSKMALWPDLYHSDTAALVAATQTIDYPSNLRILDHIVLNDGTNDGEPLGVISYEEWLENREDETSANYDEPDSFAVRGGKYYLDPTSDGAYTATIYFWRYHPDQDTILFGEQFREAVYNGVMAKYMEGLGLELSPGYAQKNGIYQREIALLLGESDKTKPTTEYNRI